MKGMNKAKSVLMSKSDINAVCITSDGSVFNATDFMFADAHSQRFDDQSIVVVGKSDQFKKDHANLFFKGSKWMFETLSDAKPTEPSNDDSKGQENDDLDSKSIKELKAMAKNLDGYKSSMKKSELINLING